MRRRHWLLLIVVFALGNAALLVALSLNVFVAPASASLPVTLAFATYAAGEVVATDTPAPPTVTLTPLASSTPEIITYTYTVVEGDTLWDIAWRFNVSMATLLEANPSINPDVLYPGDLLIIPAVFGPVETRTPTVGPAPVSPTPVVEATPTVEPSPTLLVPTPTLAGPLDARVAADGQGLRFRQSPGTAGVVMKFLDAFTPMTIIGRTEDGVWAEVVIPGEARGWVMVRWLEMFVNLSDYAVTGVAVDASPTPPPSTRAPTATRPSPTPKPTTVILPSATAPAPTDAPTSAPTQPPPTDTLAPPTASPAPTQVPIYPYVSGISEHAHQIFLQGQALGNRADVFSKIGDSITVSPVFLNPIASGSYNLQQYGYLQPVIDYYSATWARTSNSFGNSSLAAKVGWTAGAALNPANRDTLNCLPNETPLVCEYRVVKPSVAIILLGTNDVPGTSLSAYEANMRRVIETTVAMGVIPVVSTLPPMHRAGTEGRVEQFNGLLAALTREYDVPLLDYGSALQGLPNNGLGSDGVHPSWAPAGNSANFTPEYLQYGMTVRNLTALWALDAVWKFALKP
jgi:LysM repeat protein